MAAKLDLDWTRIVSPIDGISGIAVAQIGDLINANSVLTTVSQVDPLYVNFTQSAGEVLALRRAFEQGRLQRAARAAGGGVRARCRAAPDRQPEPLHRCDPGRSG